MFLHYVQQPQVLYVAGFKPLNMETCVSVSIFIGLLFTITAQEIDLFSILYFTFYRLSEQFTRLQWS